MPVHTRQVALLQAVASLGDQGAASGAHLNASWKASAVRHWPPQQPIQTCRQQGSPLGLFPPPIGHCLSATVPRVKGEEASSTCVIERTTVASLLQPGLLASPGQLRTQQGLRHSVVPIHPSTCFSLCGLILPVNHSLSLRSIGSYRDPHTDTNLCPLIHILTLTHPSSLYPVINLFHWCVDSHYIPYPHPLIHWRFFPHGLLDARNHRQYQTRL